MMIFMGNEEIRDIIREELQKAIKDMMNETDSTVQNVTFATATKPVTDDSEIDDISSFINKESQVSEQTYAEPRRVQTETLTERTPMVTSSPIPEPQPGPSDDGSGGVPFSPPMEPPPPSEPDFNEWQKYEKSQYNMSEYLESEWDHKSWMLSTKFYDKDIIKLHELVLKELSLSNIPDAELAFIYAIKMDCIEEWLSMGMMDLAKQRLVHMLFRLRLLTSIDGLELVGQHGTSAISMSMDRPEVTRQAMEEDMEQQKKPKLGLGAITNRLKRATK